MVNEKYRKLGDRIELIIKSDYPEIDAYLLGCQNTDNPEAILEVDPKLTNAFNAGRENNPLSPELIMGSETPSEELTAYIFGINYTVEQGDPYSVYHHHHQSFLSGFNKEPFISKSAQENTTSAPSTEITETDNAAGEIATGTTLFAGLVIATMGGHTKEIPPTNQTPPHAQVDANFDRIVTTNIEGLSSSASQIFSHFEMLVLLQKTQDLRQTPEDIRLGLWDFYTDKLANQDDIPTHIPLPRNPNEVIGYLETVMHENGYFFEYYVQTEPDGNTSLQPLIAKLATADEIAQCTDVKIPPNAILVSGQILISGKNIPRSRSVITNTLKPLFFTDQPDNDLTFIMNLPALEAERLSRTSYTTA